MIDSKSTILNTAGTEDKKSIRILFLSASPEELDKLQVIAECNSVEHKIKSARHSRLFDFRQSHEFSITRLQEYLIDQDPQIVHFSGHGDEDGVILFQEGDESKAPVEAIADLFKILNKSKNPSNGYRVRCVVLNACFSKKLATAIAKYVDCVIGMSKEVRDDAAKAFAQGLYYSIASGHDVQTAFEFGRNNINLSGIPGEYVPSLVAKEGVDPKSVVFVGVTINAPDDTGKIERYKKNFERALTTQIEKPRISFSLTYSHGSAAKKDIDSLITELTESKRVIMQGNAGGGKTMALAKLANHSLEKGMLPVLLNLKGIKGYIPEFHAAINVDDKFDTLLKVSIADLDINAFKEYLFAKKIVIMADGLNEVPAGEYGEENIRDILEVLGEYTRRHADDVYVLVTDRRAPRQFLKGLRPEWKKIDLDLLGTEEVREKIREKFKSGAYDSLPLASKELLSKPYFLNLALESSHPDLGYAAKALEAFFKDQMKFDEQSLDKLARAAFIAYSEYRSRSFDFEKFKEIVGDEILFKLESAGIIRISENRDRSEFDHQLKHDYLASRHLARHEELWSGDSFDAVSFDSSAVEVLSMILEQLTDTNIADKFLKSVFNWNWRMALSCMEWAIKTTMKKYSQEIEVAVLAYLYEKLFDPVAHTRKRIRELPTNFSVETIERFVKVSSLGDIFAIVNSVKSDKEWFMEWRRIFTRYNEPPLEEKEIELVMSEDPLIGWATSNVLKRFQLGEEDLRQLRAIYKSSRAANEVEGTVRYRVVHSLGSYDNKKNADLLLDALRADSYNWTRFGASRSLVEIAARTSDAELRKYVIDELQREATSLPRKVLDEIGSTAFYSGAHGDWCTAVTPLLEAARDSQKADADRKKWNDMIADFREVFCKKEGGVK